MRSRHVEGARAHAVAVLQSINAHIGQDFYTLTSSQVDELLKTADLMRYQKPRNANGSRARYFYALIQRHARQPKKARG